MSRLDHLEEFYCQLSTLEELLAGARESVRPSVYD